MDDDTITQDEQVQNALLELVADEGHEAFDDAGDGFDSVSTFNDAGVMTYNKGLVVRLRDGSEYQITIVRSR